MTSPNKSPVVLCVGLLTLDLVQVVDRVPGRNEKVVGRRQELVFGGPAANAAATAVALGCRARLVAPFGQTPLRDLVRRQLSDAGIVWHDPRPDLVNDTPLSCVLIDAATGERAVISGGTVTARAAEEPRMTEVPLAFWDGVGAVLVDAHGIALCADASREGAARGIPVVLDGGSYREGLERLLPDLTLALFSEAFRTPDGSDPLAWARGHGARYAARSRGALPLQASLGEAGESVIEIPVPRVPVVDTVGAGDVLHGAVAARLARDQWVPNAAQAAVMLEEAARVASRSVQFPGAHGWMLDRTVDF